MQLFEEISTLLSVQKPFVCFVKPNECIWNLQVQETKEIVTFSGQSGFVFMPFDAGVKICIPTEISTFSQGKFENLEQKSANKFTSEANQKEEFETLVSKGITAIQNSVFDKVVLSRKIVLNVQISVVATFQNLIATYPTAFRYLFFHPEIGLWMGATPERLVKINQNQFETVALAGTQLFSESIIWNTKEIEEQQFVTDFIISELASKVKNLIVSEPKTIKAGNLAHLKSIINGQLSDGFSALDLITTLHPTPAVCGLPKESALEFIQKNEAFDRMYYSGFLGEYNSNNQTDLFVNLRCLEVVNDAVNFYVGCGITKDSNPEMEFLETENKSMTMRNIIVDSGQ